MINKKFMSKAMSIAIVGITISTPILNTVYAMDRNYQLEVYAEKKEDEYKEEFRKIHGTEDKFKVYLEENGVKAEANGARGIIRITTIDTNSDKYGEVIEINAFESIKDAINEDIQMNTFVDRPGAWKTQGPDKARAR